MKKIQSTQILGNNVQRLLKSHSIIKTQEILSSKSGVGQSTISRILRGETKATTDTIDALARAFGVSAGALMTPHDPSVNVVQASIGTRHVPLISEVQAGSWRETVDNYQPGDAAEWLVTDADLSDSAFALEIRGRSMLPDFREGDRVIIDPEVAPQPGDYVVAKNGEHEATFKKYRPRGLNDRGDEVFELVPLNEDYPSMRSDLMPIKIVGTMIEHRRYRKK